MGTFSVQKPGQIRMQTNSLVVFFTAGMVLYLKKKDVIWTTLQSSIYGMFIP
jgi:hypothetical protein